MEGSQSKKKKFLRPRLLSLTKTGGPAAEKTKIATIRLHSEYKKFLTNLSLKQFDALYT
jgi:hypothetical protein